MHDDIPSAPATYFEGIAARELASLAEDPIADRGASLVDASLPDIPVEVQAFDIDEIDPGVRRLVALMRVMGLNTTDSGDGRSKPPEERSLGDTPHVFAVEWSSYARERKFPGDTVSTADIALVMSSLMVDMTRLRGWLLGTRDAQPGQEISASFNACDGTIIVAVIGFDDSHVPEWFTSTLTGFARPR